MSAVNETWDWLHDAARWHGSNGIAVRSLEHLGISAAALAISAALAIPLGLALGYRSSVVSKVLRAASVARSAPTLGTIALVGVIAPHSIASAIIALIVLSFPTILVAAMSGIHGLSDDVRMAGPSLGMTRRQAALQVELPLAFASIVSGLRAASVQVVSTATLCAYVSDIGLGAYLFEGLRRNDMGELFGCTIVIVALVLVLDTLLSAVDRRVARRYVVS